LTRAGVLNKVSEIDDEIVEEYCSEVEKLRTDLDTIVTEERYLHFIRNSSLVLKMLECL
jgi:hypothetical protein